MLYVSAKRAVDIFVSSFAIIILAPFIALVGLLVWLTDFGPIFFKQKRVGINGQEFWFYKIRSMIVGAEKRLEDQKKKGRNLRKDDDHGFKDPFDDRRTWIGKFIRKFSIDELPQFWNVLRGDMTLVGPRPAIPHEVSRYNHRQRRRLAATPGLTCIWQVSGRSDLDFAQQVDMDLRYIRERSFVFDLKLMALTVPAVISGKGAY